MSRDTMQHHLDTEQLLRYLDGDLHWVARRASRKHLSRCSHCAAAAEGIRQVESEMAAYLRGQDEVPLEAQAAAWKTGMRADLSRRLDQEAASLPAGLQSGWWPAGRLMLAVLALAGLGLAVMAVRHWSASPKAVAPSAPVHVAPPEAPTHIPAQVRPEAAATLPAPSPGGSAEVAAVVALHQVGADLGEPVRISAGPDGLTVFCGDLGRERELEIRTALATIPGITFRMEPPSTARPAQTAVALAPQRGPLVSQLEIALGGAAVFQSLANAAVDEDDQLMAVAHAIRNLDMRFPPAREAGLNAHDQSTLKQLRADLEVSFRGHAGKLLALIAPVRRALAAKGETDGSGFFESAQRMDRAVLTLFGGTPSGAMSGQLATEFEGAAAQLAAVTGGRQ